MLTLKEFISMQVAQELAIAVQDRDVLEKDSAIKVFERAWGWVKLVGGIFATAVGVVTVVVVSVVGWKASDFLKTVDTAKQTVTATADTTRTEIKNTSAQSLHDIQEASRGTINANKASTAIATQLSREMKGSATQTKAELRKESASIKKEVAASQSVLQEVKKLQPEFDAMRVQLTQATSELETQRKAISSSEDFAKHVFSSHTADYFRIGESPKDRYAILLPLKKGDSSGVFLLLKSAPISETLQLQFGNLTAQQNLFHNIHNLVYFTCVDCAPDLMKTETLSVSYFPDPSDKEIIKSLTEHDGRIFADDQPLRNFNQSIDPDFKGNKWTPPDSLPSKP